MMDEENNPISIQPRHVIDVHGSGIAPLGGREKMKRAHFAALERIDQYAVAKAIYQYLEMIGRGDQLRFAVFTPDVLEAEHRGTWIEYYLCRALVEAIAPHMEKIVQKAKLKLAEQIEQLAKGAEADLKQLQHDIGNDRDFRARLAMRGLGAIAEKEKETP